MIAVLSRLPLAGLAAVLLFAAVAHLLAKWEPVAALGTSPLIIGILLGAAFANASGMMVPLSWQPGIVFSAKTLLRLAVVFYGFRVTLHDIASVGVAGVAAAAIMVVSTFVLGTALGVRLFRLPPPLALMVAAGSAVCGAAAVLATEPVVRGQPHESGIAVGTVVIFGTLGMLILPLAFGLGWLDMDAATYGVYAGASLHEVANVVAAGRAVGSEAAATALIVKMTRVLMLAPLLAVVGVVLARRSKAASGGRARPQVPWFVTGFALCVAANSTGLVPPAAVDAINQLDLFALTMAMCALGLEIRADKVRAVGPRPFVLACCLALWLYVGGYWVVTLCGRLAGSI